MRDAPISPLVQVPVLQGLVHVALAYQRRWFGDAVREGSPFAVSPARGRRPLAPG